MMLSYNMCMCVLFSIYQVTKWGDKIKVQSIIAYLLLKLTKTLAFSLLYWNMFWTVHRRWGKFRGRGGTG